MKSYKLLLVLFFCVLVIWWFLSSKNKKTTDFVPVDVSGSGDSLPAGSSITSDDAKRYAIALYDAMKDVGTDEDVIKQIRGYIGTADALRLVYNAFGKKPYGVFGAPAYSWFPSSDYDLKGWLHKELSGKELKEWDKLFSMIGM